MLHAADDEDDTHVMLWVSVLHARRVGVYDARERFALSQTLPPRPGLHNRL